MFIVEDIRDVVWICDSCKSPGSNEFHFSFIKKVWEYLKGYIMELAMSSLERQCGQKEVMFYL